MPVVKTLPYMLHLRQVRKAKPNRHTGYREVFLQVSHTLCGKVHSSKAPKLPLETSSDRKWHRMTPSLVLGQIVAHVAEFLLAEGIVGQAKPTVSLGVTYAVVYTYGRDDGRSAPTHCAIIA